MQSSTTAHSPFVSPPRPLASLPALVSSPVANPQDPALHQEHHPLPLPVPLRKQRRPAFPRTRTTAGTNAPPRMRKALEGIRAFLASKSCYDILPESFRLIVFDTKLGITKSLQALVTNGASHPLQGDAPLSVALTFGAPRSPTVQQASSLPRCTTRARIALPACSPWPTWCTSSSTTT